MAPAAMPPAGRPAEPVPVKPEEKKTPPPAASIAAPATLVVTLPENAKLVIDEHSTVSTAATRVFSTPVLEPGKEYFYTLKAEITREGRVETATKRVAVRAGQLTRTTIEIPAALVSAN